MATRKGSQVIPAEAVEAAAKRLARHNGTGPGNWEWYVNEAKAILEAAAPYMLAAVWDEAYEKGSDWGEWSAAPIREEPQYSNPYRPTQ